MDADYLAALEEQLTRMQSELIAERQARLEADRQISILLSEKRSATTNPTTVATPRRVGTTDSSGSVRAASGQLKGTAAASPQSVLRELFRTPPRHPSRSSAQHRVVTPSPRRELLPPRLSSSPRARPATPPPSPRQQHSSSPRPSDTPRPVTVLELSWRRFVARVASVMRESELALVSGATLVSLMDSFGVTDELERTRIEAQWAILQRDAEDAVNRGVYTGADLFGIHKTEFTTRSTPPKPKLSKRQSLEPRALPHRTANPNDCGERVVVTPRARTATPPNRDAACRSAAVSSNPNELLTPDHGSRFRPSFRATRNPPQDGLESPGYGRRGIAKVPSPQSTEQRWRGIRSDRGSTALSSEEERRCGLRAPLEPPSNLLGSKPGPEVGVEQKSSRVTGIRTQPVTSPTSSGGAKDLRRCTSPTARRDSLVTESLVQAAARSTPTRVSPMPSPRQQRTPFALDE